MSTHAKKLLSSILILSFLLQVDGDGEVAALYHKSHKSKINCPYACARRCRKSSRKNVCTRACGTCCMRCKCVPPGTYGNKSVCPCYAKLKTHGHRPKCP
ncbi:gibberellin-regulated protein 9-like isoform X2 [Magnolia sinica]|uniref:gibberellin-regulated protein 9-like isoform X2 n=1 Tax=Magnolia sinica TaxID=86752 RepID=UPI0026591822|nr:gibberellin-regulated protein 9-like isoform X2 [Magnolia sinica]